MAAVTILAVEHGWAGDRKRNRAQMTLATTNADTVTPQMVGLQRIEAVVPTNMIGDVPIVGETNTITALGLVSLSFGAETNTFLVTTAGNLEAYFYGW